MVEMTAKPPSHSEVQVESFIPTIVLKLVSYITTTRAYRTFPSGRNHTLCTVTPRVACSIHESATAFSTC
jgi:hypothetical protein